MQRQPFSGVLTALATPFDDKNLEVDLAAFRKLLRLQKASGIHGVVVAGTTGESPTLTDAERDSLVAVALEERTDDFAIYVGTGTNDTRTTVALSRHYASFTGGPGSKARPDGVMVVVPYYNKPTQQGLLAHFGAVAEAVPQTPVCLYNVPGRTGAALAPATVGALMTRHTNIVALKEATGDVRIMAEMHDVLAAQRGSGRNIELLSGDDPTFAPALLCGATGIISVTTHIIPEAMLALWRAARENDFARVKQLHLATLPVNTNLFCAPNPLPLKWALAHLGICGGALRPPMAPLSSAEGEIVRAALAKVKTAGIKVALPEP